MLDIAVPERVQDELDMRFTRVEKDKVSARIGNLPSVVLSSW